MEGTVSVEIANPFIGMNQTLRSIHDIKSMNTNVVFKSENGAIVSIPNDDTSLLLEFGNEGTSDLATEDTVDIYYYEGNAYRDQGKCGIYHNIISKAKTGHIFKAEVINATRQGLLLLIDRLQCFMPLGQIDISISKDLDTYVGRIMDVKLISVKLKEEEWNRFLPIVSHKSIFDEKNAVNATERIKELTIGKIITGTVKSITNYGVFVTLFPSIDGLIYIADLSWERVTNPADIVSVGQTITVVVLDIKPMKDGKFKIGLGLKQLSPKPWELLDKNTKVGDIISGIICNITDYGIFIMLPSKVQGLVHRTELSWDSKVTLRDFQKGQTISAKIINIDWVKERLLLSIKQTYYDPWVNIDKKYNIDDIIDVTVTGIKNFGIFVNIENGINGFIPISELTWVEKIKNFNDNYKINDHLKAIIIFIDKEKKVLELSCKRLTPNP